MSKPLISLISLISLCSLHGAARSDCLLIAIVGARLIDGTGARAASTTRSSSSKAIASAPPGRARGSGAARRHHRRRQGQGPPPRPRRRALPHQPGARGHEALLDRAAALGRDDDAIGGQRQARSRAALPSDARRARSSRAALVHRGPGIQRQGPYDGAPTFKPTTPDEARANVRSLAAQNVDVIKIWMTNPKFPPEVIAAIVDEGRKQADSRSSRT